VLQNIPISSEVRHVCQCENYCLVACFIYALHCKGQPWLRSTCESNSAACFDERLV